MLHDDLVRQAEERSRLNKMDRYHASLAELQVINYLYVRKKKVFDMANF